MCPCKPDVETDTQTGAVSVGGTRLLVLNPSFLSWDHKPRLSSPAPPASSGVASGHREHNPLCCGSGILLTGVESTDMQFCHRFCSVCQA